MRKFITTLLYTALFALSVVGVGVYVYASTLGVLAGQTDKTSRPTSRVWRSAIVGSACPVWRQRWTTAPPAWRAGAASIW